MSPLEVHDAIVVAKKEHSYYTAPADKQINMDTPNHPGMFVSLHMLLKKVM